MKNKITIIMLFHTYLIKRARPTPELSQTGLTNGMSTTQTDWEAVPELKPIFTNRTAQVFGPLRRLHGHDDFLFATLLIESKKCMFHYLRTAPSPMDRRM